MKVSRRRLLDLAIHAAATPACATFLAEWARGQHNHAPDAPPEPGFLTGYKPKFFDAADFKTLEDFTAILIPTDETPGAPEAQCAAFIDFVLSASGDFAPETQQRWRDALRTLRETGFHGAQKPEQDAIVEAISRPERDGSKATPAFSAYRLIKRETAFAFYTSREGLISCLDYRGNSYNLNFPACTHPEHHVI